MVNMTDVSFRYSVLRKPILKGFSWQIENGLNILLGPNGAGKSTVLQIIAGLLRHQSGVVSTMSKTPGKRAELTLGYLPQDPPAIKGMKVAEQIRYHLWLSGMPLAGSDKYVTHALGRVHMERLQDRPAHQLSGGERRRLGIACAIVHEPDVLLLDEPTAGLDPLERRSVESIICDELKGRTVLVTTHKMEGIVGRSDHVAIMADGELLEYQPSAWFMRQDFAGKNEPWMGVYRKYFEAVRS